MKMTLSKSVQPFSRVKVNCWTLPFIYADKRGSRREGYYKIVIYFDDFNLWLELSKEKKALKELMAIAKFQFAKNSNKTR